MAPTSGMGGILTSAGGGGTPVAPPLTGGGSGAGGAPSAAPIAGGSGVTGAAGAGTSAAAGAGAAAAGGAGAPATAGGAGGGPDLSGLPPATMAPTYKAVFTEIIANNSVGNCTFGPCHGSEASPENGNLQLLRADATTTYANLVGVKSRSGSCGDMPLVNPGQPETSLLLLKLRPNPPCGARMPIEPAAKPLTDAQMQQIEAWIKAGAMND